METTEFGRHGTYFLKLEINLMLVSKIKDSKETTDVTLWGDLSQSPIKAGDYISLTNTSVGVFINQKSLSTTQSTVVKVSIDPSC